MMNFWSALVLIVMSLVVGFVAWFTNSPNALWAFILVVLMGVEILKKDSNKT